MGKYSQELQKRIDNCNTDYRKVFGKPFNHFFCPITYRDEETEIIKGHIINKDISWTNKDMWIPQRADIDNFYGSAVEADFMNLEKVKQMNHSDVLFNSKFKKTMKFELFANNSPIKYDFIVSISVRITQKQRLKMNQVMTLIL